MCRPWCFAFAALLDLSGGVQDGAVPGQHASSLVASCKRISPASPGRAGDGREKCRRAWLVSGPPGLKRLQVGSADI